MALISWITSDEATRLIQNFQLEEQPLFIPIDSTD
jgi:ABC-type tungstate transport system permease subunit